MKKVDVIIVGAGPGGLAAGLLLSNKGYSVKIFEKKSYVGG
ncbi:MAG: NAD(P)-binding protein, partial [Cetobacterium sp.]